MASDSDYKVNATDRSYEVPGLVAPLDRKNRQKKKEPRQRKAPGAAKASAEPTTPDDQADVPQAEAKKEKEEKDNGGHVVDRYA